MLTWPHEHGDWGMDLPAVEATFLRLAEHISRHQRVVIACWDENHALHVKALLRNNHVRGEQVQCYLAASNDSWARDHGPITVDCDGVSKLVDFRFNGWGEKFIASLDDLVSVRLQKAGAFGRTRLHRVEMVLEGGSIETDGSGTLLTTASCLLSRTRNPTLSRHAIEEVLKRWFGTPNIYWLQHGALAGDDTDGHIDMLARFCDETTIAYVSCDVPDDEHFSELRRMADELRALRNTAGQPFRMVPLPWPAPRYNESGQRLPLSYANFVIVNRAVLVPSYDDPADVVAQERLAKCFPGREIIAVPSLPLIRHSGGPHCVTMQLPEGVDVGDLSASI